AYLTCTSRTRRSWRCATFALCAATVLAVGFSRIYLDMHWLSDVGVGSAIGFGYLAFTIRLVERVPAPARVARRSTLEDAESVVHLRVGHPVRERGARARPAPGDPPR